MSNNANNSDTKKTLPKLSELSLPTFVALGTIVVPIANLKSLFSGAVFGAAGGAIAGMVLERYTLGGAAANGAIIVGTANYAGAVMGHIARNIAIRANGISTDEVRELKTIAFRPLGETARNATPEQRVRAIQLFGLSGCLTGLLGGAIGGVAAWKYLTIDARTAEAIEASAEEEVSMHIDFGGQSIPVILTTEAAAPLPEAWPQQNDATAVPSLG